MVIFIVVYIPPNANVTLALEKLHDAINIQLNTIPEGAVIGDFNHTEFKTKN